MNIIRKYKDNNQYIQHQLKKTLNKGNIEFHKNNKSNTIKKFIRTFKLMPRFLHDIKILCIGSRYGEEIEALKSLGYDDITGIDLIDFPPYTIKMDMHDLKFENESFDVVYTNSLDHSINLKKTISEILRVCKRPGVIMLDIELYNRGEFEVNEFTSPNDIMNIINEFGVKYSLRIFSFIEYIKKTHPFCIELNKIVLVLQI